MRRSLRFGGRTVRRPIGSLWVWVGQGIGVWVLCAMTLARTATVGAREFPPEAVPPCGINLPVPAVRDLPNGLRVVVVERRWLPLLTLHLVVKAGAEADPPNFPGTAQFAASLLSQGTANRTARQIAEAIDAVGGTLDTGAEWDNSFAGVTVLRAHTELAFALLTDIVLRPTFSPAEVERKRKQILSALEVVRSDPDYVANATFRQVIFAGTPYGHPEEGTVESVAKISPENLRAFHARHFTASNAILAVVGDISAGEAFRLAERFLGAWEKGVENSSSNRLTFPPASRRIVVIDKPDAVQTEIRIGNLGIPRDHADYYALTVANQILGGPAANRLFKALRSRQGLTYGASSDLDCHRQLGNWVAKTSTRTAETIRTIQITLEQVKRLRDHPLTEGELATAKGFLVGHLALEFETSEGIASKVFELLLNGLPLEDWNRFADRVRALRAEEVWDATRRYLDSDRNVIVLVGNAKSFGRELKKFGPVQVIPIDRLDFAAANLERGTQVPGSQ